MPNASQQTQQAMAPFSRPLDSTAHGVERLCALNPAIAAWSLELQRDVFRNAQLKRLPRDTRLDTEGKPTVGLFLVLEGEKRVYKTDPTGKEITLYTLYPGEICSLNLLSLFADKPFPAQIHTPAPTVLLFAPGADVQHAFLRHEPLRRFVFSFLHQDTTELVTLVSELAFRRVSDRLKEHLLQRSHDSILHTTHQQIADDLGAAREVISKLLKSYEKQGLLEMGRGVVRLTPAAWRAWTEPYHDATLPAPGARHTTDAR